jgi:hypothetical protein
MSAVDLLAADAMWRLDGVIDPCRAERRAIRDLAKAQNHVPVRVVPEFDAEPMLAGESYRYSSVADRSARSTLSARQGRSTASSLARPSCGSNTAERPLRSSTVGGSRGCDAHGGFREASGVIYGDVSVSAPADT